MAVLTGRRGCLLAGRGVADDAARHSGRRCRRLRGGEACDQACERDCVSGRQRNHAPAQRHAASSLTHSRRPLPDKNSLDANKFRRQRCRNGHRDRGTGTGRNAFTGNKENPAGTREVNSYFFDIRDGETHYDRGRKLMPNDEAALAYARRIIRELRDTGGYDDPALTLIVRNATGRTLFSIPFMTH
jgi:hypothetical protein